LHIPSANPILTIMAIDGGGGGVQSSVIFATYNPEINPVICNMTGGDFGATFKINVKNTWYNYKETTFSNRGIP
jgi:hypothetical protein